MADVELIDARTTEAPLQGPRIADAPGTGAAPGRGGGGGTAYLKRLLGRLPQYWLARARLARAPHPILLNFSVTNRCQSRCTTCNIWRLYIDHPEKEKEELTLQEVEKVFRTMKPVLLLNICGGEPTLREDLPAICGLAAKTIEPCIIHFPTNCLAPERVEATVRGILERIPSSTQLTVKMSLDGIGEAHDRVRGIPGNFERLRETHDRLVPIRDAAPNVYLDAGITVGNGNVDDVAEVGRWAAEHLKLDSFLHEIADLRGELFNTEMPIRPTWETYAKALAHLKAEARRSMKGKRFLSRMTQALRLVYYERSSYRLRTGRRGCFCYAGLSNAHLNPWGGLWICNVQAFDHEMGNVRDFDCDFDKLWRSERAEAVRRWVREEHCACPLVGQAFLDTMLSPRELAKALLYYLTG
ncbi:MAG: radical SAM protein [Planctomycetes bacterium]|nr:radical SAM protein [Planctomycetota bacterium]